MSTHWTGPDSTAQTCFFFTPILPPPPPPPLALFPSFPASALVSPSLPVFQPLSFLPCSFLSFLMEQERGERRKGKKSVSPLNLKVKMVLSARFCFNPRSKQISDTGMKGANRFINPIWNQPTCIWTPTNRYKSHANVDCIQNTLSRNLAPLLFFPCTVPPAVFFRGGGDF